VNEVAVVPRIFSLRKLGITAKPLKHDPFPSWRNTRSLTTLGSTRVAAEMTFDVAWHLVSKADIKSVETNVSRYVKL
jgi:hypothetical protein